MIHRQLSFLFSAVSLTACGSTPAQTKADASTEALLRLGPQTSYVIQSFVVTRQSDGTLPLTDGKENLTITFSNIPEDLCAATKSGNLAKSGVYGAVSVVSSGGAGTLTAGTYKITEGGYTLTSDDDANCLEAGKTTDLQGGSITLSQIGDATTDTAGTLAVTFSDGVTTLSGAVLAAPCTASVQSLTATTCH